MGRCARAGDAAKDGEHPACFSQFRQLRGDHELLQSIGLPTALLAAPHRLQNVTTSVSTGTPIFFAYVLLLTYLIRVTATCRVQPLPGRGLTTTNLNVANRGNQLATGNLQTYERTGYFLLPRSDDRARW